MTEEMREGDKIALHVGWALSAWTHIEFYIAILFHIVSDMPNREQALLVRKSIRSLDTRVTVINAIIGKIPFPPEFDEYISIWSVLLKRLKRQALERNYIAHLQIVFLIDYANLDALDSALVPFHSPADSYAGIPKRLQAEDIDAMRISG